MPVYALMMCYSIVTSHTNIFFSLFAAVSENYFLCQVQKWLFVFYFSCYFTFGSDIPLMFTWNTEDAF